MSSVFPYIPSIGALMGYGMRTLAQSASTAHTPSPSDAPATQADIAKALESALDDQPAAKSNARFSSVSVTLNNGKGLDIDNAARLLSPPPATGPATSLRGVEIINSATATTTGEHHGLVSSGLAPVWLENYGSIVGKKDTGLKLGGNQRDEVVNAGLIAGGNGMALEMGGRRRCTDRQARRPFRRCSGRRQRHQPSHLGRSPWRHLRRRHADAAPVGRKWHLDPHRRDGGQPAGQGL